MSVHRQLIEAVQFNCDIADAGFAGNFTMCTYLLKMREFYRWHQGLPQSERLDMKRVAAWVERHEADWEAIEAHDFVPLPLASAEFDPFDVEAVNARLLPKGLVYSAGYGRGCRPSFFLADLAAEERYQGYDILVAGREYARDLSDTPAMAQGRTIYIRTEAIRTMVWSAFEAWQWRKSPQDAMARALAHYDFSAQPEQALMQMSENEQEAVIWHEIGEVAAGELLGEGWQQMMQALAGTRTEHIARAVRDHLADALTTFPALLQARNEPSLHFYFSHLDALRKEIFPQLGAAYTVWVERGELDGLKRLVSRSRRHWLAQARAILGQFQRDSDRIDECYLDLKTLRPGFSV